jgi:hypothetical protein
MRPDSTDGSGGGGGVVDALGDGEEVSRAVDLRGSGSDEQADRTRAATATAVAAVRAKGWRGRDLT